MKFARDLFVVLGTAVLTALVAGPLLGPGTVDAVDEAGAVTPPAAVPVLTAGAVQLSLTLDQESYTPGQAPVVLFKAVNAGDRTAEVEAHVEMKSRERMMTRSRMPPRASVMFRAPVSLKLAPGETKTLKLPTKVKLAAGSGSLFLIESGEDAIVATQVQVPQAEVDEVVPFEIDGSLVQAAATPALGRPFEADWGRGARGGMRLVQFVMENGKARQAEADKAK